MQKAIEIVKVLLTLIGVMFTTIGIATWIYAVWFSVEPTVIRTPMVKDSLLLATIGVSCLALALIFISAIETQISYAYKRKNKRF